MPRRKEPKIPDAVLDQLLAGADPKAAFDPGGLPDGLKTALTERALNAEMDHHLAGDGGADNSRNGYGKKAALTETGKVELEVPRDRRATFDPRLIAEYQRRFPGGACPRAGKARPGGRQDRLDARVGHEHTGGRRLPARAVRRRGLARPGQRGDRRGA